MLSPQKGNLGVSFNNTKISGSGGVIANLPSMFLQSEVANLYSKLAVLECRAQECRSTGVQEYRSTGVQAYRSVGVQEYNSTETNFTNSEILSKYGGYGTKFYSN